MPETETTTATRFKELKQQWKQESQFLSNTAQMSMLPSYQKIIGWGLQLCR